MFTIVLLTEDALTAHDVERVAALHAPDPVSVRVLVPVSTAHNRLVETLDDLAPDSVPTSSTAVTRRPRRRRRSPRRWTVSGVPVWRRTARWSTANRSTPRP